MKAPPDWLRSQVYNSVAISIAMGAASIVALSGCQTPPGGVIVSQEAQATSDHSEPSLFARNLETDPLRFAALEELPLPPTDILQIALQSAQSAAMLDMFRERVSERLIEVEGPFSSFPSRVTWTDRPCSAALAGFAAILTEICAGSNRFQRISVSAFHHANSLVGRDDEDARAYMREAELMTLERAESILKEKGWLSDGELLPTENNNHLKTNPYSAKAYRSPDNTLVVVQYERAANPSQEKIVAFSLFRAKVF